MRTLTNRKRKLIDKIWAKLEEQKGGLITTDELNAVIRNRNGGLQTYCQLVKIHRQLCKKRAGKPISRLMVTTADLRSPGERLSKEHVEAINRLWNFISRRSDGDLTATEVRYYIYDGERLLSPSEIRRKHYILREQLGAVSVQSL